MDPNELIRYAQNPKVQLQAGKQLERKKKVPFISRILALPIALGSIPDVIYNKDPIKYLKNIARGIDTTVTGTKHSDLKTTTDLLKQMHVLQGKSLPSRIANLGVSLAGDIALDPTMYFSAPKALLKKDAIKIADDVAKNFTVSNREKLIDRLTKRGVSAGADDLFLAGDISAADYLKKAVARADVKEVKTLISDIGEKKLTEDPQVATALNVLLNPIAEGAGLVGRGANKMFPEQTAKLKKKFNTMFRLGQNAEDAGLGDMSRETLYILENDLEDKARRNMNAVMSELMGESKEYTPRIHNELVRGIDKYLKEYADKPGRLNEVLEKSTPKEVIAEIVESMPKDIKEEIFKTGDKSPLTIVNGKVLKDYKAPRKIAPRYPNDYGKKLEDEVERLENAKNQIMGDLYQYEQKEFDPNKIFGLDTEIDKFEKANISKQLFSEGKGGLITDKVLEDMRLFREGREVNTENILTPFKRSIKDKSEELASKFKKELNEFKQETGNQFDVENFLINNTLLKLKKPNETLAKLIDSGDKKGVFNYIRSTVMRSGREYADELLGKSQYSKNAFSLETPGAEEKVLGGLEGNDIEKDVIDLIYGKKYEQPEDIKKLVKESQARRELELKKMREDALKPRTKEQLKEELLQEEIEPLIAKRKQIAINKKEGVVKPETKPKTIPVQEANPANVEEYKMLFEDSRLQAKRYADQKFYYNKKLTEAQNKQRVFERFLQKEKIKQSGVIEDQIKAFKDAKGYSIVSKKAKDGYVKINNNTSLNGLYIPKEASEMLDEYYKAFNPKDFDHVGLSRFSTFVDQVNNAWKKIVTTYSPWTPGYGARNAIGDFINVQLGGFGKGNPVQMWKSFTEGFEVMDFLRTVETKGMKEAAEKYGTKTQDLLKKAKLIRRYSIVSGKFSQLSDDLGRFSQKPLYKEEKDWWTKNIVGSLEWREKYMRVTNFLDKLNQHTPAEAARLAKLSSLDFAKMTATERQTVKRLIPFYGFLKTNMEHQLDVLSKSHKPLLIQEKIFNNLKKVLAGGDITEEDWNNMPDWITDGLVIPVSKDENGNVKLMSGFGEPTQALNELININDPKEFFFHLASQVTPLIKFPIELTTGYSVFKKKPIKEDLRGSFWKDFPLPFRKALGWKGADKIAENGRVITTNTVHPYKSYALQTMPFVSPWIHQARNLASTKNDPLSAILNLSGLLGGKIRERNVYGDARKANEQAAQDLEDIISNMAS